MWINKDQGILVLVYEGSLLISILVKDVCAWPGDGTREFYITSGNITTRHAMLSFRYNDITW